jgi:uncharacterized membrane protein
LSEDEMADRVQIFRTGGRVLLAAVFLGSGTLHFLSPAPFLKIMPPYLPHPLALLHVSGVAEIAGGLGLLVRQTRRAAALGLVALLVAVWPANLYMAMSHVGLPGVLGQSWAQWLRVPLQIPLILWAWSYTRPFPR